MIRKILSLVTAVCIAVVASACTKNTAMNTRYFFAMDTYIEITADFDDEVFRKIETEVLRIDKVFDAYSTDSELHKINQNSGGKNAEIAQLSAQSNDISKATDGYFDVTLFNVTNLWSFGDKNYLPTDTEIDDALLKSGYENLTANGDTVTLKNGAKLNFGAIAKGYASDKIANIARVNGVKNAIFALGGNVVLIGNKNGDGYSVGIADPNAPDSSTVGSINGLSDCFAVTSGGYQRYFEKDGVRYSHIFGRGGRPAQSGLLSVTVVASSGTVADAYSTALYAMGLEKSLEFYSHNGGFEAVFVTVNFEVYVTDGLKNYITLQNGEYCLCD